MLFELLRPLRTAILATSLLASAPLWAAPVDFIPAQTPYLVARTGPAGPASTLDRELLLYGMGELAGMLSEGWPGAEGKPPAVERLIEQLGKLVRAEQWALLGLKLDGQIALYGRGLLPVLRIELADPAKFELFVQTLEAANEAPLRVVELSDGKAWILGDAREPAGEQVSRVPALLLGIQDGAMVASFVAPSASDDQVQVQLGKSGPSLGAGGLKSLQQRYGFGPGGIVLVDSVRLAAQVFKPGDPADGDFREQLELKSEPTTPLCQVEALALAGQLPRLVWGLGQATAKSLKARWIVELEPGLAGELSRVSRSGPSLAPNAHALDLALALDLRQLTVILNQRAQAAAAAPWLCPEFSDFNEANAQFANPETFLMADPLLDLLSLRFELPGFSETGWQQALLSLEARDPLALFRWVGNWDLKLSELQVAADGVPVVARDDEDGRYLLAISGQRLTVVGGADAETRIASAASLPRVADAAALSLWLGSELFREFASAEAPDSQVALQQLKGMLLETRLTTRGLEFDVQLEQVGR